MEFRSARHTNNLTALFDFYTNILGMELLFSFENHNGYSGAFVGIQGQDWHLEFTQSGDSASHSFDEDDVWVFYPSNKKEYAQILQNISNHGIQKIAAKNPFWNDNGVCIQDPDGFRVIISSMKIA